MKTLLAIPAHGQNTYLEKMLDRISKLTVKPTACHYVIDRPKPGELDEANAILSRTAAKMDCDMSFMAVSACVDPPEYAGNPQMNPGTEYFLAGHVRNTEIEYAVSHGYDIVIFIDGDCTPEPQLVESHERILGGVLPAVSVGKRREVVWGLEDQRMASPRSICHFFKNTPSIVDKEFWFVDSGVIWTCNVGLNISTIKAIRSLNQELYGREEVFSSDFHGTWGGEDGFLGLECFYSGIPVFALPDGENGIIHQPHMRPLSKYDHPAFMPFLETMREDLLYRMRLHGKYGGKYIPRTQMRIPR